MTKARRDYTPALRFQRLTRFYDGFLAAALKEERFKKLLIERADIQAGERVLDLGCGTGTLTILLKREHPCAHVVGLDADSTALKIAQQKACRAGVNIEFRESLAREAPFGAASFNHVVSSLFFHHLDPIEKRRTLQRVLEWLQPGGVLHVADWGRANDALMRLAVLPVQFLDGFATTSENVLHGLVPVLEETGFHEVTEIHRERTTLGILSLYRASKSHENNSSECCEPGRIRELRE